MDEVKIGNILNDNMDDIFKNWNRYVNIDNHYFNIKLRKINQTYVLLPSEKRLLSYFISSRNLPSFEYLSRQLNENSENVLKK